jgi:hypothetical protein
MVAARNALQDILHKHTQTYMQEHDTKLSN